MQLTKEKRGECSILLVHGRLDGTTSPKFETEVLAWLGGGGKSFVLDMAGISFMSSAALRVLLSMAKRVGRTGGKVVLSSPNPVVSEVFEISNFSAMFTICQTLDEGVNAATAGIAATPATDAAAKAAPIPVPPVPAVPPPAQAPKAAATVTPPIPPVVAPAQAPVNAPAPVAPRLPSVPPATPPFPAAPAAAPAAPVSTAPAAVAPAAPQEPPKAAVASVPVAESPVAVPPPAPVAAPAPTSKPVAPMPATPEPPPTAPMAATPAPETPRVAAEKSGPRPAPAPSIMEAAPTMPMAPTAATAPIPRTMPAPAPAPAAPPHVAPPAPVAQPKPLQEPATVAAKAAPAAASAPKPAPSPKRIGLQKLEVLVGTHIVECRDGDVIGREGTVATHLFKSATALQPRHLLIGKGPDEWFIMVPRNVQVVTHLDNAVLTPGVRQPLTGEHRLQVDDFAISLRLSDAGPSSINDSFFTRLMKILHIG